MKEEKFPYTQNPPHEWEWRGAAEPQRGMQKQVLGRQNRKNSPQR